jgi:hypothetical protein
VLVYCRKKQPNECRVGVFRSIHVIEAKKRRSQETVNDKETKGDGPSEKLPIKSRDLPFEWRGMIIAMLSKYKISAIY